MRKHLLEAEGRFQLLYRSTSGALVRAHEPPGACEKCGGPMEVQKTIRRSGTTLEHGQFQVVEHVYVCKAGCSHPSGARVIARPSALTRCLLPRSTKGYDLMVNVGLLRFRDHRQVEEIRAEVGPRCGVALAPRGVSYLASRFLGYLKDLHQERAPALRAVLNAAGGWALHVDATGEDGRGTLLCALSGWQPWVLGAWKIPTEREDQILPHLRSVVRLFGPPCAVMRDLGRAMIPAAAALVAELGLEIPVLSCHLHFARDVGKDLLKASYNRLRQLFKDSKVGPRLASLVRDLGRKLGPRIVQARVELGTWLEQGDRRLPPGMTGLATVRAMAQWALDYSAESENLRFPFDRPLLDLYRRCLDIRRALDDLLRKSDAAGRDTLRAMERLGQILEPVVSDASFAAAANTLEARAKLLDELRDVLRLDPIGSSDFPLIQGQPTDPAQAVRELDQIRQELDAYRARLQEARPERGPAQDIRRAIDLIERHLVKYGPSLWGHAITLPGGVLRLVARTNNVLETIFRILKQGERRRSGRKVLTQDLEYLPAEALLVLNLLRSDYVEALCGSLENLPRAFADFDQRRRSSRLNGVPLPTVSPTEIPPEVASASLPRDDRRLVRSSQLREVICAAASSRAPRVCLEIHR